MRILRAGGHAKACMSGTGSKNSTGGIMEKKRSRAAWPLAIIGLGVLTAGAWLVSEPKLEQKLSEEAARVVKAAGGSAEVKVSGRDVTLSGSAPSRAAREEIVRRVHAIHGVRRVNADGLKVVLRPPTVNPVQTKKAPVAITGTWPHVPGAQLSVRIGDRTWVLGKDAALSADDGNWRLELKELPAPGTYDVVVLVRDGDVSATDAGKDELVVRKLPPPPPPPPPPAPGVKPMLTNKAQPRIVGVIAAPEKVKQLKVELAGRTYAEGDGHLSRSGSAWVLVPAEPLKDGTYDVKVIAIGEGGAASTDTTRNELSVDTTPPARPQVDELLVLGGQAVMRGTWPEGDAKLLRVIVGGKIYDLGEPGSPLTRDGDGRFRLMLPASELPAMREATILVVDAAGNVAEGEKPANVGNVCQQKLNDVLIQDMIHFQTGSAEISEDSMLLLDRLAEVLKGCPDMEVVIVGHTDNVGDLLSNQKLSEERAMAVKNALVERGLNADYIIARGEGENQPLVPNSSDRNRQINRRIEISVRPRQQAGAQQ